MSQNVRVYGFLTIATLILVTGCKIDNAKNEEVADPETQYFEDYESPGNKWGFLDTAGNIVIGPRYDQVSAFSEGLAPVNYQGKWGYIDKNDSVIIPFDFRAAWQFRNGIARVLDFEGNPCILHRNGRTHCPEEVFELSDVSDGYLIFQRGNYFGYMDTTAQIVIDARFEKAWGFNDGIAPVSFNGKQGLINTDGEYIIKPEYDRVYPPSSGRILIKTGNGYRFLNMSGDRIGGTYVHATPFKDSIAAVADASGWFLINLREEPLTEIRYTHMRFADGDRWVAKQGSMFGVLDPTGSPLTPLQYEQINNFSGGFAAYLKNALWGFLDTAGNEITPPQYGLIWDFHDGLARAAFSDGIAYINSEGIVPFRPDFFEVRDFSEGLAPFQHVRQ